MHVGRDRRRHAPCRLRLHVHDTDTIMLSLSKDTSDHRIHSRSETGALNARPATPYPKQPAAAVGERLLSPHEIAILMVLASEPRRQQGDPADLRCLADRGLVRLDTAPLAEAHVRLSDDGCQVVSRLAECDRVGRDGNAAFTAARRMATAAASRRTSLDAPR
ncbi:hypothetical protein [Burkholderia lata]|uniref:hypothetical protein n=1 Tax=Burkholderia lata (strain ATCC 17760 / DSM 23089 / LMG 22485 / NCIMB 9086 / R18194 / 383) TaxID=482957 RepID=UPI001581F147|nr:hypothetical protein [Burkholderia lata]